MKEYWKESFRKNYSLKTVNVPKKVKTIQFATFENCVNLKKVNMKSVTSIERRAFAEIKN
ncbi:MAG: leucine-rich repeat protein [Eubacterium ventriosum]